MSVEFESVKRLDALKQGIEAKTGETYADLTGGVNALIAGYGQGGGYELFFTSEGRCYSKNIELPEGITTIGAYTYSGCEQLTLKNNRLPESIKTVNQQAFFNCSNMVLERLPTSIETIGVDAFSRTQFIGKEIPPNIKNIGNYAFGNCKSITEIRFKGQPAQISPSAFHQNIYIKNIHVPWNEGEVANAPWGAVNATIHYNTTYDENGDPIE